MNRLMIINLLFKVTTLYKSNQLDYDSFLSEIENLEHEIFDEDKQAYMQTRFIYSLFDSFSYHQIEDTLGEIISIILELTKDSFPYVYLVKLFKACLEDMLSDIKRRIQTEAYEHILVWLQIYYYENHLSEQAVFEIIERNLCNPVLLTSFDIAENYVYPQSTLPGIKLNQKRLREQVSKSNNTRKEKTTRFLREWTYDHYNEKTLETFIHRFYDVFESLSISNKESCLQLMTSSLDQLYAYLVIEWSKKEETNQLSFHF